jgi:hypothetical protein
MSWIDLGIDGAVNCMKNTEKAAEVGRITIRYSEADGVYDLITFYGYKYWIYEYSFTSLSEAEAKAKELV